MSTPEALKWVEEIERMQGGANGLTYNLRAAISRLLSEREVQHAEIERLTAERDEARTEARVAYLAFEQVKASSAKLRQAIAALLDDDDHDTAKELARAALKGDKP